MLVAGLILLVIGVLMAVFNWQRPSVPAVIIVGAVFTLVALLALGDAITYTIR